MNHQAVRSVFNEDDSTGGFCDHCNLPIESCRCEITCQECEDAMPRRHKCANRPTHCDRCGETVDDCHCQPADHYD
jgi:hypothetical protein